VIWRAGIDLEPPDIDDADDIRWLEALIWPEEEDRLERFRASLAIARRERLNMIGGDLLRDLEPLADQAPREATLVIFHSAVLSYLSPNERDRFASQVKSMDAEWISNEGDGVVETLPPGAPTPMAPSHFLMSRRGEVQAACDPHGRWVQWLR
jgi:hypothetical protein